MGIYPPNHPYQISKMTEGSPSRQNPSKKKKRRLPVLNPASKLGWHQLLIVKGPQLYRVPKEQGPRNIPFISFAGTSRLRCGHLRHRSYILTYSQAVPPKERTGDHVDETARDPVVSDLVIPQSQDPVLGQPRARQTRVLGKKRADKRQEDAPRLVIRKAVSKSPGAAAGLGHTETGRRRRAATCARRSRKC